MNDGDKKAFLAMLQNAMGAYPNFSCGQGMARAYFLHLREYELPEIEKALTECVRSSTRYPPTATAVREACASMRKRTSQYNPDAVPDEPPPAFAPVPDLPWAKLTGAQRGAALARSWESWRGPVTDAEAARRFRQLRMLVAGDNPLGVESGR